MALTLPGLLAVKPVSLLNQLNGKLATFLAPLPPRSLRGDPTSPVSSLILDRYRNVVAASCSMNLMSVLRALFPRKQTNVWTQKQRSRSVKIVRAMWYSVVGV